MLEHLDGQQCPESTTLRVLAVNTRAPDVRRTAAHRPTAESFSGATT
jgi:hypothetical protein